MCGITVGGWKAMPHNGEEKRNSDFLLAVCWRFTSVLNHLWVNCNFQPAFSLRHMIWGVRWRHSFMLMFKAFRVCHVWFRSFRRFSIVSNGELSISAARWRSKPEVTSSIDNLTMVSFQRSRLISCLIMRHSKVKCVFSIIYDGRISILVSRERSRQERTSPLGRATMVFYSCLTLSVHAQQFRR